jgi:peptidoglycan/xylan/chitin deacetylase (PgdA/CDA1 family)
MFIHQIPTFIPTLFPRLTWQKEADRQIYLTFDDGPTPEITDFVLECLAEYDAKATFFCIGKNVDAYPTIIQHIKTAGHSIGNHTMHHSNAWKMDFNAYEADKQACDAIFKEHKIQSIGFRPPYGRITRKVYQNMENVIMWSVLTGDYNNELKANDILASVLPLLKPGAIVVMHDSMKAAPHLKQILPVILAHCASLKLSCSAL